MAIAILSHEPLAAPLADEEIERLLALQEACRLLLAASEASPGAVSAAADPPHGWHAVPQEPPVATANPGYDPVATPLAEEEVERLLALQTACALLVDAADVAPRPARIAAGLSLAAA